MINLTLECEVCFHKGGDVHEQPTHDRHLGDTTKYLCDDGSCLLRTSGGLPVFEEVRLGKDIGRKDNPSASYIWHSCIDCGKERWVRYILHKETPERVRCYPCGIVYRNKNTLLKGENHPNYKGDNASPGGGGQRARRLYKENKPCELCGNVKAERYHKDSNTLNNESCNVVFLCRRCHMKEDGRLLRFIERSRGKRLKRQEGD